LLKQITEILKKTFDHLFQIFLNENTKSKVEFTILMIAIGSFFLHLAVITLVDLELIQISDSSGLFKNPIAAIYTPFSFILIYEVYLLIYYLPKSITVYIGKQYEIMTLILIRRLFKDLSHLQLTSDWFAVREDMIFTYDLITTVILFFLISVFYSLNPRKEDKGAAAVSLSEGTSLFIRLKNWIAALLVPVFAMTAAYSLFEWVHLNFMIAQVSLEKPPRLDGIFFHQFFTILILVDVLLLLISFLKTDRFSTVIRNSGFIISTILMKVSFGTEGLLNNVLVVVAVLFGVTVLAIKKRYIKLELNS
jgi:hypothetical protein